MLKFLRYYKAYEFYIYKYLGNIKRVFGVLKTKDLCLQYKDNIGDFSYGFPEIFPFKNQTISIGKYCSFANGIKIFLGHEHHTEWMSTYPFGHFGDFHTDIDTSGLSKGNVKIGNDVWVGFGATILSGVQIGDGAVVAAGSLVVKDVEPFSIVGGVPAKLIRYRFDKSTINLLKKVKWWNWSQEKIQRNLPWMCSKNFTNKLKHENKIL